MKIETFTKNGVVILKPNTKRIDARSAVNFKSKLTKFIDDGKNHLVINLAEVHFIDSSGLGVLVSAFKELGNSGELKLCEVKEGVRSIFELTHLDRIFDIHRSEKGAVESFTK